MTPEMTPKQAIEQIDRMIEFENKCRPNAKRIEALEMAKQALVYDESNYETIKFNLDCEIHEELLKIPNYDKYLKKQVIRNLGESIAKELISRGKLYRFNYEKDPFRDSILIRYIAELKIEKDLSENQYINPFIFFT